jgi:hypothetical protein
MLATFIAAAEVVLSRAPVHGAPYPGIQEWGRGVPQGNPWEYRRNAAWGSTRHDATLMNRLLDRYGPSFRITVGRQTEVDRRPDR